MIVINYPDGEFVCYEKGEFGPFEIFPSEFEGKEDWQARFYKPQDDKLKYSTFVIWHHDGDTDWRGYQVLVGGTEAFPEDTRPGEAFWYSHFLVGKGHPFDPSRNELFNLKEYLDMFLQ